MDDSAKDAKVDIATILSKLASESDRIVGNPADIEHLLRAGVTFDPTPKRALEESIDLLFSSKRQHAVDRARLLRPAPHMPYAVMSLYEEIVICIIFGMYVSGILVEFVLKFCTYVREAGGYDHYDPDHWDQFEKIAFASAIKRAANP